MFGASNDKNQSSDPPATDMPGAPAVDTNAAGTNSPQPDMAMPATSAPTLSDPTITGSNTQPQELSPTASTVSEASVSGTGVENTITDPGTQIGPAKPNEPGVMPSTGSMVNSTSPVPATGNQDLIQIKQQALQSLEPLVGRLNQTPDEKFKTLMMLIQASDNSEMLKEAFDAANQITDEEVRAQALLDVVNEINYFTHQAQAGQ